MIHFLNYCGILQIMVKCALFSVVNTDPDLEIFSGSRAGNFFWIQSWNYLFWIQIWKFFLDPELELFVLDPELELFVLDPSRGKKEKSS